jgi:chromosome segregation ATPase
MSIKKKVGISDLLRDEAQKGNDEPILEIKAEVVSEQAAPVVAAPVNVPAKADPLNSALAQVNALETALAASQSREADLQKELQFSKTNVELLQKSLTAIETLKSDLEQQLVEVKRDNLRLAEANIQLSEQIQSLEAKPIDKVESVQLAVQPTHNNRATPRKQPVEQPYPHRDRNPYARPTGSNEQLQRINNKNIGWMD